ncbi:MAG TPA: ECF-type sigma factor [Verrucomicrobiae bacterium]
MVEEPNSNAAFVTTRWSVVAQARGDDPTAHQALEELCRAYWFPLYAFARRSGFASADAKDLVQGFFIQVLEKDLFSRADAEKGKLRTFLLTAFKRHIGHEARRESSQKRGGGTEAVSFDVIEAESWYAEQLITGESADKMYDRQWALTLLENVITDLGKDWAEKERGDIFDVLRPYLTSQPETDDYARAEEALNMSRPAIKSAVHRLRTQYRDKLIRKVRETQLDENDFQDEIRLLLEAVG